MKNDDEPLGEHGPGEPPAIGTGLRRLRTRRGLSLERLARASGVSRAMLSQIELGQSTPSINVLWKIARALELSLSSLVSLAAARPPSVLRADAPHVVVANGPALSMRSLCPPGSTRSSELFELHLAPHASETLSADPVGTSKTLVVVSGSLEIELGGETHVLEVGDAFCFESDLEHVLRARGERGAHVHLMRVRAPDLG